MHVFRPLFVVLVLIAGILIARTFIVPKDFGIHEQGYMYGWYRKSDEDKWKAVKVKFQGQESCKDCHPAPYQKHRLSPHAPIQCENCHGPKIEHPSEPAKLVVDRSRDLCLRCHTYLSYPSSRRAKIRGIDPGQHNPGMECVGCHDAHQATKPG